MNETVKLAKDNGVLVGAHPSLPDRQGFGRREMLMEPVSSSHIYTFLTQLRVGIFYLE